MNNNSDFIRKVLENPNNDNIINLSHSSIKQSKNKILQQLFKDKSLLINYHKKLKDYRYIRYLNEINIGSFIKYISLKDPENIILKNGGYVIDIIKHNNNDYNIKIKMYFRKKYRIFEIKFDEVFIFQKLSVQEKMLLEIIDYI